MTMPKHPNPGELELFVGDWVAIREGEVVAADDSAEHLVETLRELGLEADSMFRVLERHR